MIQKDNVMWDRRKYAVISVLKIGAPSGLNGNWYQYIVGRSNACLLCKSQGTLEEVIIHAEKFASDLNSRQSLKIGSYGRNIIINYKNKEND